MKRVSLSGESRTHVGKKDANNLRREGRVPAVLYGGKEQTHFHIDAIQMSKLFINPEIFQITLEIAGKKTDAIIKDVQQHPVSDKITHVDFLELDEKKEVRVNIPIRLTGTAPGVVNGGRLQQVFRRLRVIALPGQLPAELYLDISKLKIGDSIRVGDLDFPELTFLHDPKSVVVAVKTARTVVLEEDLEEDEEGEEGEEGAEGSEGGEKGAEGEKKEESAE